MSIEAVQFSTVAFPGETENGSPGDENWNKIEKPYAFKFSEADNLRVLSTNEAEPNSNIWGVIYVPELLSKSCKDAAVPLLPSHPTRREDLPDNSHSLVALAPWFSIECTIEYLEATNNEPVSAFIFFRPDNSTDAPPSVNDPGWSLKDGGMWKKTYQFPVFAIPSSSGFKLVNESALYSGDVSQVPNGEDIKIEFPDTEFVRIGTVINVGSRSPLPNLWVFLLIVASMLVVIVCSASAVMHLVQLRRRNSLRRRVRNGDVDLEALGVKRLTVPPKVLEKLPTYNLDKNTPPPQPEIAVPIPVATSPLKTHKKNRDSKIFSSKSVKSGSTTGQAAFSQTHCSICLEEYSTPADEDTPQTEDSQSSFVRELPCRHIFHPSCIDNFLLKNSSLCPICKVSVLPKGFCDVPITNAMVRRERRARQLEAQARELAGNNGEQNTTLARSVLRTLHRGLRAVLVTHPSAHPVSNTPSRLPSSQPPRTIGGNSPDVEMVERPQPTSNQGPEGALATTLPTNSAVESNSSPAAVPLPASSISNPQQPGINDSGPILPVAVQDALAPNVVDADEEAQRASGWKRFLRRLFPV